MAAKGEVVQRGLLGKWKGEHEVNKKHFPVTADAISRLAGMTKNDLKEAAKGVASEWEAFRNRWRQNRKREWEAWCRMQVEGGTGMGHKLTKIKTSEVTVVEHNGFFLYKP